MAVFYAVRLSTARNFIAVPLLYLWLFFLAHYFQATWVEVITEENRSNLPQQKAIIYWEFKSPLSIGKVTITNLHLLQEEDGFSFRCNYSPLQIDQISYVFKIFLFDVILRNYSMSLIIYLDILQSIFIERCWHENTPQGALLKHQFDSIQTQKKFWPVKRNH